ncbi:MAG: hypothetical protein Q4E87_01250 [bacterium]|nr:hypothetical protein [bacterium]
MKKLATLLLLLLNVTNTTVFANCVTGYACSIKDLEQNNTNSVIKKENETEKIEDKVKEIDKKSINEEKPQKDLPTKQKPEK